MNLPAITVPKSGVSLGLGKYLPFVMPVGAILVSVVVAYFVIWPKFSEVLAMRTSNQQLDVQAAQLEEKARSLGVLAQDKLKLEKQLGQAEQLLPSDDGVFLILTQVENAAISSGVLIDKMDVNAKSLNSGKAGAPASSQAPDKSGTSSVSGVSPKVELKVSLTGGYKSFLQFLGSIYLGSRVISIDDLTLTSSSGVVRSSLSIDAFWKPLPTDLGSVDKPI